MQLFNRTNLVFKILSSLAMLGVLGTNPTQAKGIESSGGADHAYRQGPAWFMSKDPGRRIKTCYVYADDFGLEAPALEDALNEAANLWERYIINKKVSPSIAAFNYPYFISSIDLKKEKECDGSEDLKIYFGVTDDTVAAVKKRYLNPYGFVEVTLDNHFTGWAKGFMYIAHPSEFTSPGNSITKPWAQNRKGLVSLLLHEMGHILGNDHVQFTIMDDRALAYELDSSLGAQWSHYKPTIDKGRELYFCDQCSATITGKGYIAIPEQRRFLEKLFGRSILGEQLSAKMLRTVSKDPEHLGEFLPHWILTYTDQIGSVTAEINIDQALPGRVSDDNVFILPGWIYGKSLGFGYNATLSGPRGIVQKVIVSENMDSFGYIVLIPVSKRRNLDIFVGRSNLSL